MVAHAIGTRGPALECVVPSSRHLHRAILVPNGRAPPSSQCPLLALSGHFSGPAECPLLGVKRTSRAQAHMSASDPKRTLMRALSHNVAYPAVSPVFRPTCVPGCCSTLRSPYTRNSSPGCGRCRRWSRVPWLAPSNRASRRRPYRLTEPASSDRPSDLRGVCAAIPLCRS